MSSFFQPMHDDWDLRQEQLNKTSLLSSKRFLQTLLEMFNEHVVSICGSNETSREKTNNVVYEQVGHKLACTSTEDG